MNYQTVLFVFAMLAMTAPFVAAVAGLKVVNIVKGATS
jgi:hypothetical protein